MAYTYGVESISTLGAVHEAVVTRQVDTGRAKANGFYTAAQATSAMNQALTKYTPAQISEWLSQSNPDGSPRTVQNAIDLGLINQ